MCAFNLRQGCTASHHSTLVNTFWSNVDIRIQVPGLFSAHLISSLRCCNWLICYAYVAGYKIQAYSHEVLIELLILTLDPPALMGCFEI